MNVIGFRVYSDKKIYYCIIEKLADDTIYYLDYSSIEIPQALNWPEALEYTRNTILDILNLYEIKHTVIRIAEFDGASLERCYIEGVLQEAIASSPVEKFQTGQISTIASLLNIQRENFKQLVNNETLYTEIPDEIDWIRISKPEREAILTANSALNL
ncbi:MAG: hypothetical protein K9G31_09635 [Crocinitomicaceae bacterium]|nr:hypothetical protein [Crocinitomicaceae bacterium]